MSNEKNEQEIEFDLSWVDEKLALQFPPPSLPLIKDYSIYERAYFSILDALKWHCYQAEKIKRVDSIHLKTKAQHSLLLIRNTIQGLENKNILALFDHLSQVITEHLILPKKLKHKHVKRFLSGKTRLIQDTMNEDGYSTPAPEEVLLPLIASFSALSIIPPPTMTITTQNSSFSKIMSMMKEHQTENRKRPESPSSEETASPTTPNHYEMERVYQLGLRKKARVDYREEGETPKICRMRK